nr:DCC1-like thiol-disulfide oxidoreductase family protein [Yoonia sediminilitoris]
MIQRLDRSGQIRIAPIQGQAGAALMRAHGLDPVDPESWLFITKGRVCRDADEMIALGQAVGGVGHVAVLLRLVPRPARCLTLRFSPGFCHEGRGHWRLWHVLNGLI